MKRLQNTISFDEKMNTLANIQRRKLLVSLLDHNPQDDEPVVINASESDAEAMDRLIKMKHVHLPKLVEYDLIVWNEDTHEVSRGAKFDEIRPILELLAANEDELPEDWL